MARDLMVAEKREETYRGIHYVLKHLKHPESYAGEYREWWVLENDNTPKHIKELAEKLERKELIYNFLWEDSLHTWTEGHTPEQLEDDMRKCAKKDIDELLGQDLIKKIDERIAEFLALKVLLIKFKSTHNEKASK